MFLPRKIKHYIPELSKRYGITQQDCKKIIIYFFKNLRRMMYKGQEIHIRRFGRIIFKKALYAEWIRNNCK